MGMYDSSFIQMTDIEKGTRTIVITIEFDEVKDAKYLLSNLSTVVLNKREYESKHLSAKMQLEGESILPFQEPRFEQINGVQCMVFKSIM